MYVYILIRRAGKNRQKYRGMG
ncbi:hypothetical protein AAM22_gp31 [Pantoea phage vB_PagM_AAM22]|nr:hypothetical protein AAM22_gp31 [Pantoea phage vB_PagM_AAM22]